MVSGKDLRVICPWCGTLNQGSARFCISCGKRLGDQAYDRPRFLFNARKGNNSPWRYILTIILTLGGSSILVGIILGIFLGIFLFLSDMTLDVYSILFNPFWLLVIAGMVFCVAYIFLYLSVRFLHNRSFKSLINTGREIDWRRIVRGAIVWFLIMSVIDIIYFMLSPESFKFSFEPQSFLLLSVIALIVFPIQASFEEVFFRGYLLQALGLLSKSPFLALIANSLIFAGLHWWNGSTPMMSLSIVISAFIIGLMLGLITLADDGIELAVGIHIINNLYVSVIHNSPDSGLGNLPSLVVTPPNPYLSPIILLVAVIVVIFILFRDRREDVLKVFK
ncbi:MAG: protease family protein [Methanobacteriaceae archaeon]|nr:protease family protein [Methanobacteriaceae archaeon]